MRLGVGLSSGWGRGAPAVWTASSLLAEGTSRAANGFLGSASVYLHSKNLIFPPSVIPIPMTPARFGAACSQPSAWLVWDRVLPRLRTI